MDDGSDGLRDRVTRSVGWVVFERWGSRLLQLGVFAILTRLMAPELFGLIALATSVITILQVFVDSGLSKTLVQLQNLDDDDAPTAFWTSLSLAFIIYIALFFSAPLLASWLGEPELEEVLRVMGLALPIAALSQTPAALLERALEFKVLSVRQVIAAAIGALVAIPLAFAGAGIWALAAQAVVVPAVACAVLWSSTPWRPSFAFSMRSLKRLWPVGVSIMGTALLDAVQGNIDKFVIGIFFSSEILGYYYVAQRLGTILIELVTTVIARVSFSAFSRVQSDLPRLNRIFRQMTFAAGLIGIPVFGVVAILAPQIFPVVFGEGWEPAIPILWGLAGGWALGSVMYFDRTVLLATSHAKAAFWLAVLQNAVGVLLVFVLLPLGIVGVVISRWARVIVWPVRLWVMKRAIGLPIGRYLLQTFRVVIAFVPTAIGIFLLQHTAWAHAPWAIFTFVLPVSVVGTALYGVVAWWFAGEENRTVLRPMLSGMVSKLHPKKRG